ncbi:hypothetical protein [Carnobacterium divergens]|uniref:hypothetical protein n=1 Tax=Carnobacterium divergens TaxID=2748 RepID=UPI0039B109E1
MKNKMLKSVAILTILSSVGLSSNLTAAHAEEQSPQVARNLKENQNEIVQFEDSNIEAMAQMELMMILGRPITSDDMTQENLDKITTIATFAGSNIEMLNDLSKMPNLETVQILASTGSEVLDTSSLAHLTKLKEFTFWYSGSHLTSLEPLVGKPLENLTIKSLPLLDDSEKEINTMSHLKVLDMFYFSNEKSVTIGNLDNLPELKKISLSSMGLALAPTLAASTQLEYANFSDNNLTEVPNLSHSNNLWLLAVDQNKITDYTNVDTVLASPGEPSVSLIQNLLTTYHEVSNQNKLYLQENFILGHDLLFQNALKTIETQNLKAGEQKEIPIQWVDENQTPLIDDFTSHQKEFTDLKNMTITTNNKDVSVEKVGSSIVVKANDSAKEGITHVVLSYSGELKTEFDVTVN